jgi:hypothetical protein
MEAAYEHVQAKGAQPPGEVPGPWELVRLHPDQANENLGAGRTGEAANAAVRHGFNGFIAEVGSDLDRTEGPAFANLIGEST